MRDELFPEAPGLWDCVFHAFRHLSAWVWDATLETRQAVVTRRSSLPSCPSEGSLSRLWDKKKTWFDIFLEFACSGLLFLPALPGISFPKAQFIQDFQPESFGKEDGKIGTISSGSSEDTGGQYSIFCLFSLYFRQAWTHEYTEQSHFQEGITAKHPLLHSNSLLTLIIWWGKRAHQLKFLKFHGEEPEGLDLSKIRSFPWFSHADSAHWPSDFRPSLPTFCLT